jgi:hypothetical protein
MPPANERYGWNVVRSTSGADRKSSADGEIGTLTVW